MRFALVILMAIGCLLGTMFYSALAEQNSELILIGSLDRQGAYRPGDVVNLTVFSYLSGERVNLSEIFVNLTDIYGGNLVSLEPVKIQKGKYIVQYNLTPADAEKRFVVTGILAGIKKTIYISIPFESPGILYITLPGANSTLLEPGQNVQFYVECFFNSTLTEPENIGVFLEFNGSQQPLNISTVGKGTYKGNFTVPQLNRSERFKITAYANIAGKVETASISLHYIPFSVWYHPVRITETTVSLDIGICDGTGVGVRNATIKLSYATEFFGDRKEILSRTNADGVAHFYLFLESLRSCFVYIWGEATVGTTRTEFFFSLRIPCEERPNSGFDVILCNSTYANGTLEVRGTAYLDHKPFNNSKFFYFLRNWGETHGNFTTDESGNFSIEIQNVQERYIHPYFGVTLIFVAAENSSLQTEEIVWLNLPIDYWIDTSLVLEHTNFEFGKVLELTLYNQKTFLTPMFSLPFVGIYDGDLKTTGEFSASWYPVEAGIYFVPINTTTMRCSVPIPAFAYSGQKNISIAVLYYESGTFIPHMAIKRLTFLPDIRLNFSVVIAGEDYIVVKWNKYEGENFVKYEILAEINGELVSVVNITDRERNQYRITVVNGEPVKAGKEYRLRLRVYFDTVYIEESVNATTQPKVPGFTAIELFAILLLLVICVSAALSSKRCT